MSPRLTDAEREALRTLAEYVESRDPRKASTSYEEIAAAFYRETMLIAPGSSIPAAMGGYSEEREKERYEKWRPFCNRWHEQASDDAHAAIATLAPLLDGEAQGAEAGAERPTQPEAKTDRWAKWRAKAKERSATAANEQRRADKAARRAAKTKCAAITRRGNRCDAPACTDGGYCFSHAAQAWNRHVKQNRCTPARDPRLAAPTPEAKP